LCIQAAFNRHAFSQQKKRASRQPLGFARKSWEQRRSQDFSKGGAEVMEAKAVKRKNCL